MFRYDGNIYNKDKQSVNRARIVRKSCEKIQEVLENLNNINKRIVRESCENCMKGKSNQ